MLFCCFLSSCQIIDSYFSKKDRVLAEVSGNKLKKSMADKYLPPFSSKEDSTLKCKKLVNDWITDQLIIKLADSEESIDLEYIEEKVKKLQENLIIHEYCQNYLKKNLDTNLNKKELLDFYQKNSADFILKEKIVRGYFIKIDKTSPLLVSMRKEFESDKPSTTEELKKMSQSQAKDYYFTDHQWVEMSKFLIQSPEFQNDKERNNLLKDKERIIESKDYVYFVRLTDLVDEGATAPFEIKEEMIRNIVLNNRKQELIKKLRNTLYTNATKENAYKINN